MRKDISTCVHALTMTKADPGTPGENSVALVSLGSAEDLYHKNIMHFQTPHPKVDPSR